MSAPSPSAASDPSNFLLQHFDRLAEAPGGLAKLRALILQFAVLGKTVEPAAEDTPIDRRILASKKVPTNQAEGRTGGDLGPVTFEELPYHLPPQWSWGRMFQLCEDDASIVYGILQPGPNTRPHGVPYVRPSEIENGKINLRDIRHTTREIADKYDRAAIHTGDVVLTIVGTIGATAVVPPELNGGNITQSSCRLRPDKRLIEPDFLLLALRSPCLRFQYDRFKLGTAVPRLNIAHVRALAIPLPPLAEQRRIVAKVEELMGLCDALEAAQQEREAVRTRLRTSALHGLTSLDSDSNSADFVLQTLLPLMIAPDDLASLRQSVLQLAVRGKLVPQLSTEAPAKALVRELIARRTRKKTEQSLVDDATEIELPHGWQGVALGEIADISSGSTPTSDNSDYYLGGKIPWVTSSATSQSAISAAESFVTKKAVKDFRLKLYEPGTIIVALYGQGKTRGQVSRLQIQATVNQACATISLPPQFESVGDYIMLVFREQYLKLREQAAGGAQPNLNGGKIKAVAIPLPPLAEQRRIVAKVDELMAVLDALEGVLISARTTAEKLLAATVAELTTA